MTNEMTRVELTEEALPIKAVKTPRKRTRTAKADTTLTTHTLYGAFNTLPEGTELDDMPYHWRELYIDAIKQDYSLEDVQAFVDEVNANRQNPAHRKQTYLIQTPMVVRERTVSYSEWRELTN